ncbi:helix-turn-helix domain-containing protein [Oceanicoccus sp. KOV_DT_Chl]|uniref:helix-turn-helix domain-containing protein n=1 Tax=Oceanicoccus sp. KOV_DT_Chl TaxID=1904639 RepID=UPI00350EAE88
MSLQDSLLFSSNKPASIIKWRDEKRIAYACQLLAHSNKPINTIADQVGYSDPLYFTRCFRRQMGSSPRQYRCSYQTTNPY